MRKLIHVKIAWNYAEILGLLRACDEPTKAEQQTNQLNSKSKQMNFNKQQREKLNRNNKQINKQMSTIN